MKYRTFFLGVLVLAGLACKTSYVEPAMEQAENRENAKLQVLTAPELEPAETASSVEAVICHVQTGLERGVLHLRSCPGTACAVILYLQENEALTVLEGGAWLKVETVTGKQGYVNSKFIFCEVKENE